MNRRQFTQRLGALFALPALPPPAALASAAQVGTPAAAVPSGAYFWAEYLQTLHETCTPGMLKSLMNMSEKAAESLHRELVSQGVIARTGAVTRGLKPKEAGSNRRRAGTRKQPRIVIRPATPADIPALVEIWHQGWHEAHAAHVPQALVEARTPEAFEARLHERLEQTTVATSMDRPVGLCMISDAEVYQFYVAPEGRGRGIASRLMEEAERQLRLAGVDRAFLHVIAQNPRAIAFYNKHGWQGETIHEVALETGGEPFVLPVLKLEKSFSNEEI